MRQTRKEEDKAQKETVMIDYWESIGRLASSKNLHEELTNTLDQGGQRHLRVVYATATAPQIKTRVLDIHGAEYQMVQDVLSPVLTEKFLSLMAAGELIWTYRSKKSRDVIARLNGLMAGTGRDLNSPSTSYFIALGLVIVDAGFRQTLKNSNGGSVELLPRLSPQEREQINTLITIGAFETAAQALAQMLWDGGCNIALCFWKGYLHGTGVEVLSANGDSHAATEITEGHFEAAAGK
jgi:hypothetical protein